MIVILIKLEWRDEIFDSFQMYLSSKIEGKFARFCLYVDIFHRRWKWDVLYQMSVQEIDLRKTYVEWRYSTTHVT